eukprot:scaffold3201_cov116-Isochrysis_galbana.AAC.7
MRATRGEGETETALRQVTKDQECRPALPALRLGRYSPYCRAASASRFHLERLAVSVACSTTCEPPAVFTVPLSLASVKASLSTVNTSSPSPSTTSQKGGMAPGHAAGEHATSSATRARNWHATRPGSCAASATHAVSSGRRLPGGDAAGGGAAASADAFPAAPAILAAMRAGSDACLSPRAICSARAGPDARDRAVAARTGTCRSTCANRSRRARLAGGDALLPAGGRAMSAMPS